MRGWDKLMVNGGGNGWAEIINGQLTIEEDNVPVQFATPDYPVSFISIHAYLHNISPMKLGGPNVTCDGSATDGRALTPGEECLLAPDLDLAYLYAVGRAGDRVDWVASTLVWWLYYWV